MDKFFVGNGMTQAAIGVLRFVVSQEYRAVVRASQCAAAKVCVVACAVK